MFDGFRPWRAFWQLPRNERRFLVESNAIEGEETRGNARNGQVAALLYLKTLAANNHQIDARKLLHIHRLLMENLLEDAGSYRTTGMRIGTEICPPPEDVPTLMDDWLARFNLIQAEDWNLHHQFLKIHPFADGNGRTGRLLWAFDQLRRGYQIHPLLDLFKSAEALTFREKRSVYYRVLALPTSLPAMA